MRRAIERKRDGGELSAQQWDEILRSLMNGEIDDAQMAALLMASLLRGLSHEETVALTRAMVESGETIQFPAGLTVVDKHSTGGVSDIVSLIAVPAAAACGAHVAKLSGRALGHTGGTIDKLETIAGFDVNLSVEKFVEQVERVGCAIAAQTAALVPADKRIYGLRDRTGTVPSIGLIAASIVSKKLAAGADAFVFDVKCGSAAFMRDAQSANELAKTLVAIAKSFGRKAQAIVSDMNQPLGRNIGTALEVIEARDFLRGSERDSRVRDLCVRIVATMLDLSGIDGGDAAVNRALDSGAAYEKFIEMIEAQGGKRAAVESMAPSAETHDVLADRSETIGAIDAVALGNIARELANANPSNGVRVHVRIGDRVTAVDSLARIYGGSPSAAIVVRNAFTLGAGIV